MSELGRIWEWFADTSCKGYSPLYDRICRFVAHDDDLLALVQEAPAARPPTERAPRRRPLPPARRPRAPARRGLRGAQRRRSRPALPRRVPLAPRGGARAHGDPTHADERVRPQRRDRARAHVGRAAVRRADRAARRRCERGPEPRLRPVPPRLRRGGRDRTGRRRRAHRVQRARRRCHRSRRACPRSRRGSDSTARRSTSPTRPTPAGCSRASGPTPAGSSAPAPRSATPRRTRRPSGPATWSTTSPAASAELPADALACVTTTWALAYLRPEGREQFAARLADAGRARPIVWISRRSARHRHRLRRPAAAARARRHRTERARRHSLRRRHARRNGARVRAPARRVDRLDRVSASARRARPAGRALVGRPPEGALGRREVAGEVLPVRDRLGLARNELAHCREQTVDVGRRREEARARAHRAGDAAAVTARDRVGGTRRSRRS